MIEAHAAGLAQGDGNEDVSPGKAEASGRMRDPSSRPAGFAHGRPSASKGSRGTAQNLRLTFIDRPPIVESPSSSSKVYSAWK